MQERRLKAKQSYSKPQLWQGMLITIVLAIVTGAFVPHIGIYLACFLLALTILLLILLIELSTRPQYSFIVCDKGLRYYHRRGQVAIEWHNIQRIFITRTAVNGLVEDLPYLAIQLKSIEPLLDNIALPLATAWLTEQKNLLLLAVQSAELDYETQLTQEFTRLKLADKQYHGLLAMFGHRVQSLQKAFGGHVYFAEDTVEMTQTEFLALLKQYWNASKRE